MKTSNLITILRCTTATSEQCSHCIAKKDCDALNPDENLRYLIADRLEQLLVALGKEKKKAEEAAICSERAQRASKKMANDLKKAIYEFEMTC
jgi:hypothetical protein